jgi:hypothetical protein
MTILNLCCPNLFDRKRIKGNQDKFLMPAQVVSSGCAWGYEKQYSLKGNSALAEPEGIPNRFLMPLYHINLP